MNNKPNSGYRIRDQYQTHFLTFTIVGWIDLFTRKQCRDIIIDSLKFCQAEKGLIIYSYVIMDSHIHLIVRAEETTDGLSSLVRDFKKITSKELLKWSLESKKESRRDWLNVVFSYHAKFSANHREFKLWQRSNCPQELIYPKFTIQKIDYIHKNPVIAGYVKKPEDYIYSSASNYAGQESIIDVKVVNFGSMKGFVYV